MRESWGIGELAGDFQVKVSTVITGLAGNTLVASQDPRRWELIVANITNNTASLWPDPGVSPLIGIPVNLTTGPLRIIFRQDGGLSQIAWYADGLGRAVQLSVIEVLYSPGGG